MPVEDERVGSVSINRVPEIPFAQIANVALRDRRLSYKARGLLAMVLSNVGEWQATAEWIEEQSEPDGRHAVQSALNELTEFGYRSVRKERLDDGRIATIVDWYHEPQVSRPTGNPTVGNPDRRETRASIEDHSLEHYELEDKKRSIVRKPVDDHDENFAAFWAAYPRKVAKGSARKAWSRAVLAADPSVIVAGAVRYASDPNREEAFTAHPSTWLNGERWLDDPVPNRDSRSDRKVSEIEEMIRRAAQRDAGREIES